MSRSYLEIKDLVLLCRIGVSEQERAHPQKIFVTCRIYADFQKSEASDDIQDTVDYGGTVLDIQELINDQEFHLIEHLAKSIRIVVKKDKKVQRVDIQVRKPNVIQNAAHVVFSSIEAKQTDE